MSSRTDKWAEVAVVAIVIVFCVLVFLGEI